MSAFGPGCRNEGDLGTAALDAEFFAEVEAADLGVVHDILLAALHEDLARIDDARAVGEVEGLAHIVVGDEHANAAASHTPHQPPDSDPPLASPPPQHPPPPH